MTRPEGWAAAGGDQLRAGHADREQVIQALKDAFVQGRLSRDELDERAGLALTTRTYAELAALTADLPAGPARAPAAARASLVQSHPVIWAFAGAGSCWGFASGLILFAADVLDPAGYGAPQHPGGTLCGLVAFVAVIAGIGIMIHGLGTAEEQRRTRKAAAVGAPELSRR
jgi:DUF1707 SHOCT-like domain